MIESKEALAKSRGDKIQVVNEFFYVKRSPIEGLGGFAGKDMAAGTRVIEYVGEKLTKRESNRRCSEGNRFVFTLNGRYDLDGSVDWNPARYMNHSCDPNCESEWDEGRIWILTKRAVRKGEELGYDYCYDLEDYRDHPCRCGAANCRGYIIAEELSGSVRGGLSVGEAVEG